MVGALIFDFDGLIVDTEWTLFTAWRSVFADHGAELTVDDFSVAIGTRGAVDWGDLLARKTGRAGPNEDELRTLKDPLESAMRQELTVLPGVIALLDAAAERGVVCAIASSSGRDWVEPLLGELGISDRFAVVSTWDGHHLGYGPKPEPGVYRAAYEQLGLAPRDCVAFEDSPHGVSAAKAAELACICVPNRLTVGLDLAHADKIVASMLELTWSDLERLAPRQATSSLDP